MGTIMRYSGACGCARAAGYNACDALPSEPISVTSAWVMTLGTLIHEALQEAIGESIEGAQFELPSQVNEYLSGHTDGLMEIEGMGWCLFELKTMGEFPFKKAMGYSGMFANAKKVAAPGPSKSAIIQAGMNALGLEEKHGIRIEMLIIGVITYEPIKTGAADKMQIGELDRFLGEFHISRDDWEPLARAEIERLTEAAESIEAGYLPDRFARDDNGDEIRLDPFNDDWQCNYCPHRTTCIRDNSGLVHINDSVLVKRDPV